ncbi:Glutamine transport ATP-binding protein GlnQ [compost metagenome]
MKSLARDGMTMMCVTHEMNFAREVADRVWFMDHGSLVESGTPDNFFSKPQSDRARKLLSDMRNHWIRFSGPTARIRLTNLSRALAGQ